MPCLALLEMARIILGGLGNSAYLHHLPVCLMMLVYIHGLNNAIAGEIRTGQPAQGQLGPQPQAPEISHPQVPSTVVIVVWIMLFDQWGSELEDERV
jgi:hypothetical protein